VLVATNGDEGLITARGNAGDLRVAIVDMMMPGVQGVALVRELRNLIPALPIIVCSGLDRYKEELAAEGFTSIHFLAKPFVVKQLWEALHEVLD
jgi:two-component system cell cycle sensor histidine kinase/response regulator CckA